MEARPIAKKLLLIAAVYGMLWAATWIFGPLALRRQIYQKALVDWRHFHDEQTKRPERFPGSGDMMAFKKGPSASVHLLFCPVPFIFKADCGRHIGGLNGYGESGWYFVTPWRVYRIAVAETWVS